MPTFLARSKELWLKLAGTGYAAVCLPISIIVVTPILISQLGLPGVAHYSLILVASNVLTACVQGTLLTILKEISSKEAAGVTRFWFVERLFWGLLGVAAVIDSLGVSQNALVAVLLSVLNFYAVACVGLNAQAFQGLVVGSTHLGFALTLFLLSGQLLSVGIDPLFPYVVFLCIGAIILRSFVARVLVHRNSAARISWQGVIWLSGVELFGIFSFIMDRVVGSLFMNSTAFGLYSIETTLGKSLSLVRAPLLRVISPEILGSQERLIERTLHLQFLLACAVVPAATAVSFAVEPLLWLWLGNVEGVQPNVVRILLVGMCLHTLIAPIYYALVKLEQQRFIFVLNGILLVTIVPMMIYMTTAYGSHGAATTWLMAIILSAAVQIWFVSRIEQLGRREIQQLAGVSFLSSTPLAAIFILA